MANPISIDTDITAVEELKNEPIMIEFKKELDKQFKGLGVEVGRFRLNKKKLTPRWNNNKITKNYGINIGEESILMFYIDAATGFLRRVALGQIMIEDAPKSGLKKTIKQVSNDVFNAYRTHILSLKDKSNAIDMNVSPSELKKLLKQTEHNPKEEETLRILESHMTNLKKGSGKFVISDDDANGFLAEPMGDFVNNNIAITFYDNLDDARVAAIKFNGYKIFRV